MSRNKYMFTQLSDQLHCQAYNSCRVSSGIYMYHNMG